MTAVIDGELAITLLVHDLLGRVRKVEWLTPLVARVTLTGDEVVIVDDHRNVHTVTRDPIASGRLIGRAVARHVMGPYPGRTWLTDLRIRTELRLFGSARHVPKEWLFVAGTRKVDDALMIRLDNRYVAIATDVDDVPSFHCNVRIL